MDMGLVTPQQRQTELGFSSLGFYMSRADIECFDVQRAVYPRQG
jgi:hypothetical protein